MIYLASDHAGFELKGKIKQALEEWGYEVEDCGADSFDPLDDYPDFIAKAAMKVSENPGGSKAIIFGGSGQAEMMTANKFKGVRAALFYAPAIPTQEADVSGRESSDPYEIVKLTRQHNNANVLSLGVRFLTEDQAKEAVKLWLETPFPADPRHLRRIEKIQKIEESL